uniref:Uncharacterized protein n=1 Tax=Steinernema glaseri TaxID=37863 RepID=A0A1I7ZQZ1_9BILA
MKTRITQYYGRSKEELSLMGAKRRGEEQLLSCKCQQSEACCSKQSAAIDSIGDALVQHIQALDNSRPNRSTEQSDYDAHSMA